MRSMGAVTRGQRRKGRLTKLEQQFLALPWAQVRDGVQVKRLSTEEDGCWRAAMRVCTRARHATQAAARYVERLQAL